MQVITGSIIKLNWVETMFEIKSCSELQRTLPEMSY